jgi:hypothetical protein
MFENMQIEHVHLLLNMQKCSCKICNFGNLVILAILHICYKCAHAIYKLAILQFVTCNSHKLEIYMFIIL